MKKICVILLVICISGMGTAKEIVEKYDDGCLKKKCYVDDKGKLYGNYLEYHENGKRKILTRYKDGNLHGSYQSYFSTGKLHIRASYVDGKIHGPYVEYSKKGKLEKEEIYVEGALCYPRPLREISSVIGKLEKERNKVRGPIYKVQF